MEGLKARISGSRIIACVVAATMVVGVVQAPVAAAQPAPVAPPAPIVVVYGSAASPIAAGARALIDVAVRNAAEADVAAPVTLTIGGLPAGVTLVGADLDLVGRSWKCNVTTTCTLVGPDGATPATLDALEIAQTRLRLAVDASAAIDPTVTVTLTAGAGLSVPPADLSGASTTVTLNRLAADTPGSLEVVAESGAMESDQPTSTRLHVSNLGPSLIGGAEATLVADGVLPPGSTNWTTSSAGWTCVDSSGLPSCTWVGADTGVGVAVDPLVIDFRAPSTATTDGPLSWTQTVVHTSALGATITDTTERGEFVLEDRPPVASVFALSSGRAAVEHGGTVEALVGMAGSGLDDSSRTVEIATTLPTGWSFAGSTGPWACSTDVSQLTCDRSADFGGESESSTTIVLQTDDDAAPGLQTLTFTGSVSGPDTKPPTTDDVTFEVAVVGAPLSQLRIFQYPTPDTAIQIIDGTPLPVAPGAGAQLGIEIANIGTIAAPAGSTLTFSIDVPAGTTVDEVSGADLWSCSSANTTVTCETPIDADLAPADVTPRAKLSINVADTATTGPQTWPLVITGELPGGQPLISMGARAQLPVVVETPSTDSPVLGLDVEVVQSPRETFPLGLIDVTPSNGGTAEMADGWSFSVLLPAKLTSRDIRLLSETCDYDDGKKMGGRNGTPKITCASSEPLEPGTSGDTIRIPVWVPGATGVVELLFEASADGAEDVTLPVTMKVLPPLDAIATATPDRVVLPPDGTTPVAVVLLDGRASVSDGAASTWTQIDNGAPVVTFDGFAEGEPATGLLTSFTPPIVTVQTTLSFRLTLSDDNSSSTAAVDVVVEPADAPQPAASSTLTAAVEEPTPIPTAAGRLAPSSSRFATSSSLSIAAPLAVSTGSGSWTWTVPPTISTNDHDNIDSPVRASRVRVHDYGTYTWNGPGPLPTDITVTTDWQECDQFDPVACSILGSGDVYISDNNGMLLNAVITIKGKDSADLDVTTTETYPLGVIRIIYEPPNLVVPPSISGVPSAGNTLTGDPGEWSLEFAKYFAWLACTGPDIASCSETGEVSDTYLVTSADVGKAIRLRVQAEGLEQGGGYTEAISSALQSGVTVNCGSDCYTWSVSPAIDPNGTGAPTPITTYEATLVDDGTYAWNDATAAPTTVTSEVEWFECDVATPTLCSAVGTGRSYTPTTAGVLLEAQLTLSGSFAVDGTVRTGSLTVPFGVVRDAALPPVATTLPSISGTTLVGDVLTADPGVWSFSPDSTRTYSWFRCAAANPDQCAPVGVTTPTYTVQIEDLTEFASVMRVEVTASGYINSGKALSTPSDPLTDLFKRLITLPTIDGGIDGPRVGVEATATQAVWSEMPPTVSGPNLEWQTCTSSDPTSCGSFVWSTDATFVPIDGLETRYLRVRATIVGDIPGGGTSDEEAFSDLIGPVLPVRLTASTNLDGGTASIANGETLDVVGRANDGAFPFDFVWTQTSGPSVITNPVNTQTLRIVAPATGTGLLGFRLTVTDANLESATTDITVEYGANAGPAELCAAIDEVRNFDVSKNLTYGDVSINFAGGTVTPGPCSTDSVVTITGAFVTAYDLVTISNVTVTINADGITFGGNALVALQTGTDLDRDNLALSTDATLTVPFDGDGTYEMVGAVVRSGLPALIDLGIDWTGATRIAFGNADDVQTISFGAVAWDGSFGPATPVPGQLPAPPAGSPTVTLNGSVGTDKTFSFALGAIGLVQFAGSGIDFAGTVSRSDPAGGVVFTATGSLAGPVSLADNVVLQSASLTWDGESFGGDGAVTLTVNGDALDIIAGFSFTDPTRWMAAVSVNAGGSWSPVSGLDLTNPTVTGTLSRSGSDTRFDLTIGADAVEVASGVELTNPSLRLNGSCAGGNCGLDIGVTTGLTVTMYGGSLSSTLRGTLNTATGAFGATASLGAFTIVDGLSFSTATLSVDKGSSGLAIELIASVNVFGSSHDLTIKFDDTGAVVLVDNGTWTPFAGAPTFEDSWLIYSSYATTVTVGGQDVAVGPNSLQFSARTGVPQWFADLVGDDTATATVRGRLQLTPLSFNSSLQFDFTDAEVFSVAGVSLNVNEVTFTVTATGSSFTTKLEADGTLFVPPVTGSVPSELAVRVGISYQAATGTISGSLTLLPSGSGLPAWTNAFGVDGLTVQQLSVSVGISLNGAVQLGFAGEVILPDSWSSIGIAPGTRVRLAAAIAGASSCFGIEIGTPGWPYDAIDVGGLHALTAKNASLYIAPTGCDIGATHIDPGIALSFDGAILDYDVKLDLKITPAPAFAIDASIELGDIELKDLTVKNTSVELTLSATEKRLAFAADAEVFGVTADVSGEFLLVGGVSSIEFHGTFATPRLGGFQLDELTVDFYYVSFPQQLTVDASVAVTLLDQPQTVELSFSMLNGRVIEASGNANISLTIDIDGAGELAIAGTGEFEFRQGVFPTITIDGTAAVDGRQLTAVSGTLRAGYLEFSAELNLGGIFTAPPKLSGVVVWGSTAGATLPSIMNKDGVLVPASEGDFRFEARNIGLNVSGLTVNADVLIGNVDKVFFAAIETDLNFGLSRYFSAAVGFEGSFDSTGDFTLAGNGSMVIGGVEAVSLIFSIERNGNSASVSAASTITIPKLGSVSVNGSFTSDGDVGWLYSLNGTILVQSDGYEFGSGAFTASRVKQATRAVTGMEAGIAVDIPNLAAGSATVAIFSNGDFSFDQFLQTQGDLKDVVGNLNARVSFSTTPAPVKYSFSLSVRDFPKVPGSFSLSGSIASDGSFSVSVDLSLGPWSKSKDLGVCTGRVSARADLALSIVSSPSSFKISVTIDGEASASCGAIDLSVGLKAAASFELPASTFSLKIKAKLDFGTPIGSWEPTLYTG